MEQNIVDLVTFSEVDINFDLQSNEGTDTPPTQIVMDEDIDDMTDAKKLWTSSEQGSPEAFTNVCEDSELNSDNDSESDHSLTIYTESTFCRSHEIDKDQVVNIMTEAQQFMAGEFTAEEGNMQSDLGAGVSTHKLVTEFGITGEEKELTEEYQPQISPPISRENQTPEETSSESDEELPENYSTTEQSSQCESVGNKAEPFLPTSLDFAGKSYVRDDMKEFTEEDQEKIEESLADYPSDLSHSETEEPNENATAQSFTLIDTSASGDHFTDARLEELSDAENVIWQNTDGPVLDQNSGMMCLEMISADIDLSFKRGSYDKGDTQEYLANDKNTEEDSQNKEDAGVLHDVYDQAGYISDSSADHSTSEEETNFLSSVKQEDEQNHAAQQNYLAEDITRMEDDIDYLCSDMGGGDGNGPEEQDVRCSILCNVKERDLTNKSSYYEESNIEPTELHRSIESVQSDTAIKGHDKSSSEATYNIEDSKRVLSEVLQSSALMINEDNLWLDEYDWDDFLKINLGDAKKQEYTEETLDEFNIDDVKEENDRDFELEKTRIEAFYRFYGDQPEPEDEGGRNHKVTFLLNQESSEDDEDSDSTESELDSDLNTPDVNTLKPEDHSESDDPLEKPYYPEKPRMPPKEQLQVVAAVKKHPHRNKCLSVLKSILAFGLLIAIGVVSFWWATENLDWIH